MPKFSAVKWIDLIKRLRKLGFEGPYRGGKHPYMIKDDLVLTIPNPHKKDVSIDLLTQILRRGNIKQNEWIDTE
ncbi:MAG: type II toxin-antitoxin system HicA family toxin [Candidatus Hydrogenedentota bacterium]